MSVIDRSTEYLGLKLTDPLMAVLPSLDHGPDEARRLEDAGAAAIVMHPVFEDELQREEVAVNRFFIHPEIGHAEAQSFLPLYGEYCHGMERHLGQLAALKERLEIPIIATLNGASPEGWLNHAQALEQAGAAALELNACYLAVEPDQTIAQVEERYCSLMRMLCAQVAIPIALSVPPWFSALPHFAGRVATDGATGIVITTPQYEPDIDLETLRLATRAREHTDAVLSLRWIGLLNGRTELSLASGHAVAGITNILKLLLVGADAVRFTGEARALGETLSAIDAWMEGHGFHSVAEFKGLLSQRHAADASAYGVPGCLPL